MRSYRKLSIFLILSVCLLTVLSVNIYAAASTDADTAAVEETTLAEEETTANKSSKLDMNMSGADLSVGERISYALQGTATGMLMVFAVLALLAIIVSLSKVILYDIPNKKKADATKAPDAVVETETVTDPVPTPTDDTTVYCEDDTEIAAVITAAIAAMIESGEYASEFKSGFRVVSFKRISGNGAWNKN